MYVLRYAGRVYRIPMVPFETEERAADRAWFVAQKAPRDAAEFAVAVSESHIWANTKYFNMKYEYGR